MLGVLCAVVAAAYLATLCPTVPAGDSGEYVAVACALGVAHPPGYPLHTLLGHLFTLLPVGSMAFRVNLSSAVFSVATAALMFSILRRWLRDPWAAFLGAGLFAFSTSVWRYAVVAEVFALNCLFAALLVWCLLRFHESSDPRWAWGLAFTLGLGLSHQHTLVLVAAPLVLGLFARGGRLLLQFKTGAIALACFALGLLPYLYLPWASSRKLLVSWGDLTSLDGFLAHLLRREYGTLQLVIGEARSSFGANLGHYTLAACSDLLWIGVPLALWGAWAGWRDQGSRALSLACLAAFALYTLVFAALSNLALSQPLAAEAQSRFWLLPNLFLCLLAARGAVDLAGVAGRQQRWLLPVAAVTLVGTQAAVNYARADSSHDRMAYELGRGTLESLPQGALFFVRGDTSVNAVRYLQVCEGRRLDVTSVPVALLDSTWMRGVLEQTHPEIRLPPGAGALSLGDLVDLNRERDTFVSIGLPEHVQQLAGRYELWNVGYTYWLRPVGQGLDFQTYVAASRVYASFDPPDLRTTPLRTWETYLVEQYWKREQDRAERLSIQPVSTESGRAMVRLSTDLLVRILERHPHPPLENWRTLAFAWSQLRPFYPEARGKMVEALERYLLLRPDAPDRPKIEALISSAGAA